MKHYVNMVQGRNLLHAKRATFVSHQQEVGVLVILTM